jgi:hypothetical protein
MPQGDDLGFTWRALKNGDVQVLHQGRLAAALRGAQAADFIAEVEGARNRKGA